MSWAWGVWQSEQIVPTPIPLKLSPNLTRFSFSVISSFKLSYIPWWSYLQFSHIPSRYFCKIFFFIHSITLFHRKTLYNNKLTFLPPSIFSNNRNLIAMTLKNNVLPYSFIKMLLLQWIQILSHQFHLHYSSITLDCKKWLSFRHPLL